MEIIIRLVIGGSLVFGSIWIFVQIQTTRRTVKALDAGNSRETKANITKAGYERLGKNRVYRTHYSYEVNGAIFDGDTIGNFSRIAPDGLLPIRYLVENPGLHEVVGLNKNLDFQSVVAAAIGLALLLGGIGFALFAKF